MAGAVLFVAACGDDDKNPTPPQNLDPLFPANYEQTYTMVRDCRGSNEHPASIVVHCDPVNDDSYTNGEYPFAEGTVIVKTVYADDECQTVDGYVVMKKGPPGTNPTGGDWYWQDLDASRTVIEEGLIPACISCHSGCGDRDFTCTDP